jgi:hypothetical protein
VSDQQSQVVLAAKGHQHRMVLGEHLLSRIHAQGPSFLRGFNVRAARYVSAGLSSMWFFWFCVLLVLCELPSVVAANSIVLWVTYVAQTVIQLLALPALGAYSKLISQQQDEQTKAQGETLAAIHTLVVDVHRINEAQNEVLSQLESRDVLKS